MRSAGAVPGPPWAAAVADPQPTPFPILPGTPAPAIPAVSEPLLPEAQRRWAARSIADRLQPLRRARHWMAAHPLALAAAISGSLPRTSADTLVAEVLPLLDAIRFLERQAPRLLGPRRLGLAGRPLWLAGVRAEVQHEPLGHVLVIGPANFPLFLPGAQVLQALAAGNAVTWKPGTGGAPVANLLAHVLREAGLPRGLIRVTDDTVAASQEALATSPDKVVFTGSRPAGTSILGTLAGTATPAVMELSGCDAVILLPGADLPLAAKAIAFGLRLNGGQVCMSPRRLLATRDLLDRFLPLLRSALATIPPVPLDGRTADRLETLLDQARAQGAELEGELSPGHQAPLLITGVTPAMEIARADLFAPILSVLEAPSTLQLPEMVNACPYGLTAAIFGEVAAARALGTNLQVGTVLINDLIAPTVDPRVPFSARRGSGFGETRGAEGLLAMCATKTVLVRGPRGETRHYDPVGPRELPLLSSLIGLLHSGSWRGRTAAFRALVSASRKS